jgi:23S rRNA pseudouridine2605 synthase
MKVGDATLVQPPVLCYGHTLLAAAAMQRKGNDNEKLAGERIARAIARAGLCSRREAEAWIAQGRVAIDGAVISSPAVNVTPQSRVTVDGMPLPRRERTRLFLYHKPRGLVTTHADPQGRPTIFAGLPKHLPRLISVGRLDLNTEGLLLLTNDGGLARVLELPATGWLRRYRVRALGRVTQDHLDALRGGVSINGVRYGPIEAKLDREQGSNIWLTFAIREGKNREVRNVLDHLGLKVNRLIRVSFGPFQLGELAPGDVEEVRTRVLREQLGERVSAAAGADFSGGISLIPPLKGEGTGGLRPPSKATPMRSIGYGEAPGWGVRDEQDESPHPTSPRTSRGSVTLPRKRGRDKKRRRDDERVGEPERARREKRRRFRGKKR